jgi:hypothetical protein
LATKNHAEPRLSHGQTWTIATGKPTHPSRANHD